MGIQSDSLTFSCSFVGVPAPSIDWYKQDFGDVGSATLLENNARVSIVKIMNVTVDNLQECQSTLTISSLVRANDEGVYTCTGGNGVANLIGTSTSASANLTVHGKPSL